MIINNIIQEVLNVMLHESEKKAFETEKEVQGYILGYLRANERRFNLEIMREYPTEQKYKRGKDGVLYVDAHGKSGFVDIVLEQDGKSIGIEIEYPRGKGRDNPEYLASHMRNDCIKLTNEGFDEKISMIIIYQDPSLNQSQMMEIIKEYTGIKYIYIRMRRQVEYQSNDDLPYINWIAYPDGWIRFE